MTRSELEGLLERVEKAEGPDRELDALIEVATFKTISTDDDLIYAKPVHRDDNCAKGTFWRKSRSGASLHTAPEYTDSIDGAVALVERCLPGWIWDASSTGTAWVQSPGGDHFSGQIKPYKPPLAILSALLRALLAQEERG